MSSPQSNMEKYKPVVENYMHKVFPKHTICQQLREIYHKTDDAEIKMGLRVAVAMAKAMQKKLQEYNTNWQKGFWDEHN